MSVTNRIRDRVAILCDFQNANWNRNDSSLFQLVDYVHCFSYPNLSSGETKTIAGYEGDPIFVKIPFRVESLLVNGVSPTVKNIIVQVVAKKEGQTDFVVEEKIFGVELNKKCQGAQQFVISDTRNYISYVGDPYNTVSLISDENYNSGSRYGSVLYYGMVIRYEPWIKIIEDSNANNFPIFEDNCSITEKWSSISNNGWSLALRFKIEIAGYDGWITPFQFDTPITVRQMGTIPLVGPALTCTTVYTDVNENEVSGIIQGDITHIRHIYEGDFRYLPLGTNSICGYMFADKVNEGGVTSRRFASTDAISEDDSPFTPTDVNADADTSYCNGNLRMNIFGTSKIIIESFYDDTLQNLAQSGLLVVQGRLKFYQKEEEETLQYYT